MAAFNVDDVTTKLKDCDIGHEIIYNRETTSTMDDVAVAQKAECGKPNTAATFMFPSSFTGQLFR